MREICMSGSDQGFGLASTHGAAGFPSAEAYKLGADYPYARVQHYFVRQTIDLGGAGKQRCVGRLAALAGPGYPGGRIAKRARRAAREEVDRTGLFSREVRVASHMPSRPPAAAVSETRSTRLRAWHSSRKVRIWRACALPLCLCKELNCIQFCANVGCRWAAAPDARSPPLGYAGAMGNPCGITLDDGLLRWTAGQ